MAVRTLPLGSDLHGPLLTDFGACLCDGFVGSDESSELVELGQIFGIRHDTLWHRLMSYGCGAGKSGRLPPTLSSESCRSHLW